MKRLAILGASGHGKVVADTAEQCGWQEIIFFDDASPDVRGNLPWKISGNSIALLRALSDFQGVLVAIGDNSVRAAKLKQLHHAGALIPVLQHPSAVVSKYAVIGFGSVVFANVVVNAGTEVGMGAILNTACTVDHDCCLGDGVHISPGAHLAGGVCVGDCVWIGIGASVKQLVKIGASVVVGAGAMVVNDVPCNTTVVGVPAKSLSADG